MMPELGIIEGYFGRSWSWGARRGVIDRLAPAGYRFFHYAPKIQGKLRRDWQVPFDVPALDDIAGFAAYCRMAGVRFGVGLTPYGAQLEFDDAARDALRTKLAQLDAAGIDDLVVMFDDMRGDVPGLAARQAEIVRAACDHSRASRVFVVPSYYSLDPVLDRVFGQRPPNYLAELAGAIDPAVGLYWTGEEVCSREFSPGHLAEISALAGRKLALWDNYPVNDGPRMSNHLHLRSFTGRPSTISAHVSHHAINPMSQPVLGCIAALTLAMSYARDDEYRYTAAFAEAAHEVVGPELAVMLGEDLLKLQDVGLDRLGEATATLRARYAACDAPAAREIVEWLDGGYAITGEALRTQ